MRILIQNTISKYSKTKNQTQKDLLKFHFIMNIYKKASKSKSFIKQTPKNWNSDSKYNFIVMKVGLTAPKGPEGPSIGARRRGA